MSTNFLTALPVFNEAKSVNPVLDEVHRYSREILVVDDGSTDGTQQLLQQRDDIHLVVHPQNRGYGAALATAFRYAAKHNYEFIVTIDCDGQHEPQRIPRFVSACHGVDIVSGSRYRKRYKKDSQPPAQRLWVNQLITSEINRQLGLALTDAFCGFKAYRVAAVAQMEITETGYAMPLELWVRAAAAGLKIVEIPVPLIYLDEKRSFGGVLDDAATRLEYYRRVLRESIAAVSHRGGVSGREERCGQGAC